jgi:methionine-rich copper-binding protein CopC
MRRSTALIAFALALAFPASALAHGTYESSVPEKDSTVNKAPKEVVITLTEDPAPGSSVVVKDGCKKDVAQTVDENGSDLVVAIGGGEPGRWNVRFKSISAEDGHEVNDEFTFVVAGQKDCNAAPNPDVSPSIDGQPPIDNPDDGSSFPVVPLVIGTVVVVGGALILRRSTSGS